MKLVFKAALIASALIQISCVPTKQNTASDFLDLGDAQIALLTNDTVITCTNNQLNSDSTCVKLTGVNKAEQSGKILAYGFMLEDAGWTLIESPIETYVAQDPLMTPSYIHIIFEKLTENDCALQLKLTPTTDLKTSNIILAFSANNSDCTN